MSTDLFSVDLLDIPNAINVYFEEIFRSVPVPMWSSYVQKKGISSQGMSERHLVDWISDSLQSLLENNSCSVEPYIINVNHRTGKRPWVVPSIADQIILCACSLKLRSTKCHLIDISRNFAYQRSGQIDRLHKPQTKSWAEFQNVSHMIAKDYRYALQFDLKKAFQSIDLQSFWTYWEDRLVASGGDKSIVNLLKIMLNSLSIYDGLPLIHDGISGLGCEYLNTLDFKVNGLISGSDFRVIRFMDDYRLFAKNSSALEELYEQISLLLGKTEFQFNDTKTRFGESAVVYSKLAACQELSRVAEAEEDYSSSDDPFDFGDDEPDPDYASIESEISPTLFAKLVRMCLEDPERYLNVGLGRFVMSCFQEIEQNSQDHERFRRLIWESPITREGAFGLLKQYVEEAVLEPEFYWSALWIIRLYVSMSQDLGPKELDYLRLTYHKTNIHPVLKTWILVCLDGKRECPLNSEFGEFDKGYVLEGALLYEA